MMIAEIDDACAEELHIGNITFVLVRPDRVLIANEWQGTAKLVSETELADVLSAWLRDI